MNYVWDPMAEWQLGQISDYIYANFGERRELKFRKEVEQTIDMLLRYPNSGAIDPLFADRAKAYRSVIVGGRSKMVYFIDGDIIYIASMWDCRQDPEEQASLVE